MPGCLAGNASSVSMADSSKKCWGSNTVEAADRTKGETEASELVVKLLLKDGSITAIFEHVGKGKVIYSHQQHIRAQTKCICVFMAVRTWNRST